MPIQAMMSVLLLLFWAGTALPPAGVAAHGRAPVSQQAFAVAAAGTCRVEVHPEVEWIHESQRSLVRFSVSVLDDATGQRLANVHMKLTVFKPDGTTGSDTFSTPADRPAMGTISTTHPGKIRSLWEPDCPSSHLRYEAVFEIGPCPGGALRCPGPPPIIVVEVAPAPTQPPPRLEPALPAAPPAPPPEPGPAPPPAEAPPPEAGEDHAVSSEPPVSGGPPASEVAPARPQPPGPPPIVVVEVEPAPTPPLPRLELIAPDPLAPTLEPAQRNADEVRLPWWLWALLFLVGGLGLVLAVWRRLEGSDPWGAPPTPPPENNDFAEPNPSRAAEVGFDSRPPVMESLGARPEPFTPNSDLNPGVPDVPPGSLPGSEAPAPAGPLATPAPAIQVQLDREPPEVPNVAVEPGDTAVTLRWDRLPDLGPVEPPTGVPAVDDAPQADLEPPQAPPLSGPVTATEDSLLVRWQSPTPQPGETPAPSD